MTPQQIHARLREVGLAQRVPGVPRQSRITGPLSDFSDFNKANLAKLADRGTRVHKAMEACVMGGVPALDKDTAGFIESGQRLLMDELFFDEPERHFFPEVPLGDPDGRVRGTTDLVVYDEKMDCIEVYDWKTSKDVYLAHKVQLRLYRGMVMKSLRPEWSGKVWCKCVCLREDGSEALMVESQPEFDRLIPPLMEIHAARYANDPWYKRKVDWVEKMS